MARNDIWCELCEDKMKTTAVFAQGRGRIDICDHCASMCEYPAVKEALDYDTPQESAA
jgi:ribosome-binding protein aMBF1 (putative translation factor)